MAPGQVGDRLGWVFASFATFLLLWHVIAMYAADELRFPGPVTVFERMATLSSTGKLWPHIFVTLQSLIAAFTIAMIVGSVIGILLGKFPKADKFFDPWLILFLNLPAIVIITLCLIWGGMNQWSIVTAVALNKIPNTAVTMREGTRALSRDLDEMAQILTEARIRAAQRGAKRAAAESATLGLARTAAALATLHEHLAAEIEAASRRTRVVR